MSEQSNKEPQKITPDRPASQGILQKATERIKQFRMPTLTKGSNAEELVRKAGILATEKESAVIAANQLREEKYTIEQQLQILQLEKEGAVIAANQLREMANTAQTKASEAEERSTIDELTGLLNARGFKQALTREIAEVERTKQPLSLVFMDLDGFKAVNDRLGHAAGDKVLAKIGDLLKNDYLRDSDVLARLGGDEFVAAVKAEASQIVARLKEVRETDMPLQINNTLQESGINTDGIRVSTSLGAAQLGPDAKNFDELKIVADARMYEDKDSRKDQYKR